MSYFNLGEITFPAESENDINTWADYCELFCLLSEDKFQTIDQLQDRIIEDCDTEIKKAAKRLSLSTTATGKYITPLIIPEDPKEDDESDEGEESEEDEPDAIYYDKLQGEFRFLFEFLKSRKTLFGESYPFKIEGNKISLLENELSGKRQLYVALMLSAVLRIYSRGDMNRLGHVFEKLCGSVFKKLVPPNANIYPFGAGGENEDEAFFQGTFFNKVTKLSNCIHTALTTEFEQNQHDHQYSGDGGLDWVAWYSFSDGCNRLPLFFGQCACGTDWIDKEFDAHEDKWVNNLQFHDKYLLYHFITKVFRKNDGAWYKPKELNRGIILLDRLRILDVLSIEEINECVGLYTDLINEAIEAKMSNIE